MEKFKRVEIKMTVKLTESVEVMVPIEMTEDQITDALDNSFTPLYAHVEEFCFDENGRGGGIHPDDMMGLSTAEVKDCEMGNVFDKNIEWFDTDGFEYLFQNDEVHPRKEKGDE